MSLINLEINEIVLASTEESVESIVIPDKVKATVHNFTSSIPDSALAYVKLKFGDDIIWGFQRSDKLDHKIEVKGDGVKTFCLVCANEASSDYFFNTYVEIGY